MIPILSESEDRQYLETDSSCGFKVSRDLEH